MLIVTKIARRKSAYVLHGGDVARATKLIAALPYLTLISEDSGGSLFKSSSPPHGQVILNSHSIETLQSQANVDFKATKAAESSKRQHEIQGILTQCGFEHL